MKRIKIIKATSAKIWYKDRIGEEFNVIEEGKDFKGNKNFTVHKGRLLESYVLEIDCIVINDATRTENEPPITNTSGKQ